jgi:hypothetical protein
VLKTVEGGIVLSMLSHDLNLPPMSCLTYVAFAFPGKCYIHAHRGSRSLKQGLPGALGRVSFWTSAIKPELDI